MALTKAKSMSISFKPTLFNQIDAICEKRGCSRSWFVNTAVENFMHEYLEDQEDYETAVAAWDEFEKSGGKTYSSAELREEFGL